LVVFSEDYTATNFFDFITVNCDMKDLIEETSSGLPQWSAIRIYAISVKRGHYIRVAYCRKYTHLSFMGGRYSRPAFVSKRRQVGPHSLNIARRDFCIMGQLRLSSKLKPQGGGAGKPSLNRATELDG